MKRMLRYPLTNAIGLSLFTAFYSLVFFLTPKDVWTSGLSSATGANGFWESWQSFLVSGFHVYIAYAMIALSALIVFLLMRRSHAYDEYHTAPFKFPALRSLLC